MPAHANYKFIMNQLQAMKDASYYQWVTGAAFFLRMADGSWLEAPLSTSAQMIGFAFFSSGLDFYSRRTEEGSNRDKAIAVVRDHAKALATGTIIGGAVAATSAGITATTGGFFTAAPLGAKATNAWVTSLLSTRWQEFFELQSYDYYSNLAWIASYVSSINSTSMQLGAHSKKFNSNQRHKILKTLGLALGRSILAIGIDSGMNWALKCGHSSRPIVYNVERSSKPDPIHDASKGGWQEVNSRIGFFAGKSQVKSCTSSPNQNWTSGHSSTSMLPAWIAENKKFSAILCLPGFATMIARVLADCHTPSAVISGMMLAGLSADASRQITGYLLERFMPKDPALQPLVISEASI